MNLFILIKQFFINRMQPRFFAFLLLILHFDFAVAQDSLHVYDTVSAGPEGDITVSYAAELKAKRKNTGIGETYNGGVKTVFISGDKTRIRLVSLMRTQSIFLFPRNKANKTAVVTKESGKDRYKYYLTEDEWKQYNGKYDSISCQLTYDSTVILGYPCRKAIISLKDGRSIGVFYTDSIRRKNFAEAEPLFSCIPGLVLQYEYRFKKGRVIYTATSVSEQKIDPLVFRVPVKGVPARRFSMKPFTGKVTEVPEEEEDEAEDSTEEE